MPRPLRHRAGATALVTVVLGSVPLACGDDEPGAGSATGPTASVVGATTAGGATPDTATTTPGRCPVRLHGKGGTGAAPTTDGDVTVIAPTGNADGWGAQLWQYFPAERYGEAREIVAGSVTGCEQIIVNGFSNGASFAAALYCHGETFEGRLVGVVVDDPVPDHAVDDCAPDPGVDVTLYWTGANEDQARPGWDCSEADWTCQGGETIGIDAFAAGLGTAALASPNEDHEWYLDAPELSAWR